MTRDAARARAFSLVEVMVAMVMGVIVLGVAVDVAATALRRGSRSRALADLSRDATFAARLLEQDLRLAGSGVPEGEHIEKRCTGGPCQALFGTSSTTFKSFVLSATKTSVGFVGDVPRPDGNFPAIGFLTRRPTGQRISLMWHTENNGGCAPTEPVTCTTATTSLFFPGEGGCQSDANDRTCPWGLRRLLAGEALQIVAGDQNWSHTVVEDPLALEPPAPGHGTLGLAVGNFDSSSPLPVWPNVSPETPPMGLRGGAWVTSLDRVFFVLEGDRLKRIQCRGDVDPSHADWGRPVSFSTSHRGGRPTTPNTCGPPETIARHVRALTFSYFETRANGDVRPLPLPVPQNSLDGVSRVDFAMTLASSFAGEEVQHVVHGSIQIPQRAVP